MALPPSPAPATDPAPAPKPVSSPTPAILVLVAHPDLAHSRITQALLAAAATLPGVQVRDLYALYPDYAIDVPAEQAALRQAGLLVWLHPMHWYSMPALMKLWVDEVLSHGWAYGAQGHALQGKDLWLVSSTGGSAHSYSAEGYNRHPVQDFLLPYAQTAALCGMRFLPPLLLHGAQHAGPDALQAHAQAFLDGLRELPDWCEHQPEPEQEAVPEGDRPQAQDGVPV